MDEAELISAAKAGDRQAFDELVRRSFVDTFTLARRLTGNEEDGRDVVQDAYLRAWRGIGKFRGDAQFSTWMYRITANAAATHVKRRRRFTWVAAALAVIRYIQVENCASPRNLPMPRHARR